MHRVGVVNNHQARRTAGNVGGDQPPLVQGHRGGRGRIVGNGAAGVGQQAARVSHVAHQVVHQQRGRGVEPAVAVSAGLSAAADGQAAVGRVVMRQAVEEVVEGLSVQHGVGYLQDAGVGVGGEGAQRAGAGLAGDGLHVGGFGVGLGNCPAHGHGRVALGTGRDGHPLVGVGRRHGVARAEVDMRAPLVGVVAGAELAVCHSVGGGAAPGGQEVRSETEQRRCAGRCRGKARLSLPRMSFTAAL